MHYPIKTFKDLKNYIISDLYRYMTSNTWRSFLRGWFISGFRYTFFMRSCKYFHSKRILFPLFFFCRIALRHYSIKYGFQIPWQTEIGPGLALFHYGSIIINPNAVIGSNCNITVGVLLGLSHKTDSEGNSLGFFYPQIGDRVALNNSCKILGDVKIGSDSIIGVNSVITKHIPPKSIVVGNPGKIIRSQGSSAYVGSFHPWTKSISSFNP